VGPTGSGDHWHGKPQAFLCIVIAALALLTCVALTVFDIRDTGFISAYRAASPCSSAADALNTGSCRFLGQADVVSTSTGAGHKAVVSFEALPGRTFSTFFPSGGAPDCSRLQQGDTAEAELWSGKVTRLAGKVTNDDPEEYPTSSLLELALFLGLLGIPLLVIGISLARSAWRSN